MSDKEKQFFCDVKMSVPRRPTSLNTNFPDYSEKHSKLFDSLRALEDMEGWQLKKTVDTVDIYTKTVPGEDMLYTKGVTVMNTYGNGIRHLVCHMLTAEDR